VETDHSERSRQAIAVGNAVTRLHRDRYGRGATTTRTVFHGNRIIVFLEDIYTPAERTLIDAGDFEQVKVTRQSFQMAMRGPFTEAVEEITGRKVIAFMSQVHRDPDMAAEIFVLAENAEEIPADQSRGDRAPAGAETA
jgi:uncharacterized protein YbcI